MQLLGCDRTNVETGMRAIVYPAMHTSPAFCAPESNVDKNVRIAKIKV